MAQLTVAILGLNRTTAAIGLALKRYTKKGGKHSFNITGYDSVSDHTKQAKKLQAINQSESRPAQAVINADLVVIATSYEETEAVYRELAGHLRSGAVVLDMSPLKQSSLTWAETYLSDEQHLVGFTPILNPRYLFDTRETVEQAEEDLFDNSAILLTPSATCAKEAVDLAFNFAAILGSKPRFLDPLEHDTLLAQTVQLPRLLGTALFYDVAQRPNWDDLKWLTNPDFGALTRPLFDIHPDALRDEFFNNREILGRLLDQYIETLTALRQALAEDDKYTLEAVLVNAAETYENWINSRYKADWDMAIQNAQPKVETNILQGILGGKLADKILGNKDDKDK
ncbi:MAG: prephenate dehydrogenase [Anaerolineae bacterium]